jgi:hypothetical protein
MANDPRLIVRNASGTTAGRAFGSLFSGLRIFSCVVGDDISGIFFAENDGATIGADVVDELGARGQLVHVKEGVAINL